MKNVAASVTLLLIIFAFLLGLALLPGMLMGEYKCSGGTGMGTPDYKPMECRWVK